MGLEWEETTKPGVYTRLMSSTLPVPANTQHLYVGSATLVYGASRGAWRSMSTPVLSSKSSRAIISTGLLDATII